MSTTNTETVSNEINGLPDMVRDGLNKALSGENEALDGAEWFTNWIRTKVTTFFNEHLSQLPIVGNWAARIGVTISEFVCTVISTLINFIRTMVSDGKTWAMAHAAALSSWKENESHGLLAQSYAYGKKMASYFLEILKQCLERAIHATGLEVNENEKQDIKDHLDTLLGKD